MRFHESSRSSQRGITKILSKGMNALTIRYCIANLAKDKYEVLD